MQRYDKLYKPILPVGFTMLALPDMDVGIGTTPSLLTIIFSVSSASKQIYEKIESFKDRRKTARDAQAELKTLITVLESIQSQARCHPDKKQLEPLRPPLLVCADICQELRDRLDSCTAHSTEDHSSVRDWIKTQYRGKSFNDVEKRLAASQSTLNLAFQAIILNYNRTTKTSIDDLRDDIRGTQSDLEEQLKEIHLIIHNASSELRETLEKDQQQLRDCLDSLQQAQRTLEVTRAHIVLERNQVGADSRAIFGTDSVQPQFDLTVSDNVAGRNSIVSNGVYSPETLRVLLGNTQAPDFSQTLQILRGQQTNITALNRPILQSLPEVPVEEPAIRSPSTSDCLQYEQYN